MPRSPTLNQQVVGLCHCRSSNLRSEIRCPFAATQGELAFVEEEPQANFMGRSSFLVQAPEARAVPTKFGHPCIEAQPVVASPSAARFGVVARSYFGPIGFGVGGPKRARVDSTDPSHTLGRAVR